jgi:uncharacterized membrane protein YkvA (DUF1232 family)
MAIPVVGRVNLFRRALMRARLATRLMREPQVPLMFKALLVGAACYVILPFDLIPDFLPGLGQLDDLTVTLLAIEAVIALTPRTLVDFHDQSIRANRPYARAAAPAAASSAAPSAAASAGRDAVIDAEWRRH